MNVRDGHGEEKMSCPIGVPNPERPASQSASRYTGPLLVSEWGPNYGVAEAPHQISTSEKTLWTASQNSLRHLQTCSRLSTHQINQTKQPSVQGYNRV